MNWKIFSYKNGENFAKKVGILDSILDIIGDLDIHLYHGKKRKIRKYFLDKLSLSGWNSKVEIDPLESATLFIPSYKKGRVALEVETYHQSKIGTEFLKFEMLSNKHLGYIDFGIMISFTKELQTLINRKYKAKWEGSISYEQIMNYLNVVTSIITTPLVLIGIDL